MSDTFYLDWIEGEGAQVWANRNPQKQITGWTVQVFVTQSDGTKVCVQPTCATLRETLGVATRDWERAHI